MIFARIIQVWIAYSVSVPVTIFAMYFSNRYIGYKDEIIAKGPETEKPTTGQKMQSIFPYVIGIIFRQGFNYLHK